MSTLQGKVVKINPKTGASYEREVVALAAGDSASEAASIYNDWESRN